MNINNFTVHVFNGDLFIHTLFIVKDIIKNSKTKHRFFIVFYDKKNIKKFESLSNLENITFIFDFASKSNLILDIFLFVLGYRKVDLRIKSILLYRLLKFKNNHIVLHWFTEPYLCLIPGFRNVSWVCWGNIPRTNSKGLKKLLYNLKVKYIINSFIKINCLLNDDKQELINSYSLDINKLFVISYLPYYLNFENNIIIKENYRSDKLKILLGNNKYSINSYRDFLKLFSQKTENIEFHCILNYGSCDPIIESLFISEATEIFENNFFPLYEFISLEELPNFLNQFDIYVCSNEYQSGLALIYISLFFGKTIFLTGYNLNWCQDLGFHVFDINDFDSESILKTDLLNPCQIDDNRRILLNLLNITSLSSQWDDFYTI